MRSACTCLWAFTLIVLLAGPPPAEASESEATVKLVEDRVHVVLSGDWPMVDLRYDAGEGIVVQANEHGQTTIRAESPCYPDVEEWWNERAVCPGGRRTVEIAGSPFNDQVNTSDLDVTIDLGAGDDHLNSTNPSGLDAHGGPGHDFVVLTGSPTAVRVGRLAPSPVAGLLFGDFEQIEGPHSGSIFYAVPGQRVMAFGGDDFIDSRNGGENSVLCGDGVDVAVIDEHDWAWEDCETVRRPPGYLISPWLAPSSGAPWRSAGILEHPNRDGGMLRFAALLHPDAHAGVAMTFSPWRAGADAPVGPVQVTANADRNGDAGFTMPMPDAAQALLARDGRLRVQTVATYELEGRREQYATSFAMVSDRPSRFVHDGKTLRGGFGKQRLVGSARGDDIDAASADDVLEGRGGTDRLIGGTGDDVLQGGAGDDTLDGLDGDDRLIGGDGDDDLIETRFGHDRLEGGPGDDVLRGARASDVLLGGPGDDVIDGGSGQDRVDCGPGEDIVLINSPSERALVQNCEEIHNGAGVVYRRCNLMGTDASETMLGTKWPERCTAGAGDDDLEGAGGDDILDAGPGDDRLFGRFGRDKLLGGPGNDELEGGRDADRLWGGEGNDRLNGGYDPDRLHGGTGDDVLTARGGGVDRLDCGPGRDVAFVDSRDRVRRCERVDRSGGKRKRRDGFAATWRGIRSLIG